MPRPRGIPPDVQAFIREHLSSVAQLEILLLLHGRQPEPCTIDNVAESLRIDPTWAASEIQGLRARGLFEEVGQETFRYAPVNARLDATVDGLARAFSTHRVSVITMIFSTPSDSVGSFADAFKLRRDDDG